MLEKKIDISTGIIFRTIIIILGIWVLYLIRDVLALLFIALIMTAAIEPGVDWLQRRRVPRGVGILLIYLGLFLIVGGIIYLIVPVIINQFDEFSKELPYYMERFTNFFQGIINYSQSHNINLGDQKSLQFFSNAGSLTQGIFSTTIGFFSALISLIVVLSMTFYLSVQKEGMKKLITSVIPPKHQEYAISLAERMKVKVGKWMQGQILLMIIIFALDYAVLLILGVPYALILAILAGLFEIIPYLGPIISAIPAAALGFLVSPLTGILVIAAYIAIQQAEGHIITPMVMKKAVGLNPIVVILAILIGAKIAGTFGAILAIPVVAMVSVFIKDIMKKELI